MAIDLANISQSLLGLGMQAQAANIVSAGANAQANYILSGGLRDPSVAMNAAAQQAANILQGGQISAGGAELAALSLRQNIGTVSAANNFNMAIDNLNVSRRLRAVSRQAGRVLSQQTVGQAATGLDISSKSFLVQRNEALDIFDREIFNMKIDAENQRRAKIFETQSQIVAIENQARAQDYRAKAERVLASNRAAEVTYQGEIAAYQTQINNANVRNRAAEARYQGDLAQFRASQQRVRAIPTLLSQLFQG